MSDFVPGLYQAIDAERLHLLTAKQEHMLKENRENGHRWNKHRKDYEMLRERLVGITNQPSHEVMVPLGKKAFMLGKLVHTNEILVLLGDNWFAERSAKQAAAIVDRRIVRCDEMLQKLVEEFRLVGSWKKETSQLTCDLASGEGNMEIREPYDEKEEARWREEHKRKVREYRTLAKSEDMMGDDEDLWRRLEQLEIEEELDEHLAKTKGAGLDEDFQTEGSEEISESEEESQSNKSSDEEDKTTVATKLNRKVSFGEITRSTIAPKNEETWANDHPKIISVSHSGNNHGKTSIDNTFLTVELMTPADLEKHFVPGRAKKSILKPFDSASIKVFHPSKESCETEFEREPYVLPVGDFIVEKEVLVGVAPPVPPTPRRQSKFKQSRFNK